MNVKLLVEVLMTLIVCVSVAGCVATTNTAPYELAGTWVSSGNVLIVSYDLTLACNGDGTAKLTGLISSTSGSRDLNEDLKWEYD